ncbi:discoidin domain-containing protein [Cobetia sp. 5-25-4-2]|uniref:discoidin domain-containing protein n=1 Tax=Cobetia sp. 5-25-4-2 TaxID=2737459 RepID=UPI001596BF6F|nr:discoidin domain-containing protein [Cobetia sp. 5-25-4-2]
MIDNFVEFSSESPLVVIIDELVKSVKISLQTTEFLQLSKVLLFDKEGDSITNVSSIKSSSLFGDNEKNAPTNILTGKRGFSTKKEKNPELIVTFSSPLQLSRIEIYNRGQSPRSYSVNVQVQDQDNTWKSFHDNWKHYKFKLNGALDKKDKIYLSARYFDFYRLKKNLNIIKSQKEAYREVRKNVNEFFYTRGLELTNHGIAKTFRFYSKKEISDNFKLILKLFDELEQAGLGNCFITSGTLLGMYRDSHPILHDDDYDAVLVLDQVYKDDLCFTKQKVRKFLIDNGWNANLSKGNVNLRVGRQGVSFDLFLGWREDDLIQVSPLKKSTLGIKDIFPLRSIYYEDIELPVPNNIVKFLQVNYGESWDKPDSSWKFDWHRAFKEYEELLN